LTPDADSLEALTGVRRSNQAPWTRAVWWLLIASGPIVAAAAFALRRNAQLRAGTVRAVAEAEAEREAKLSARKTSTRKRPPKR
jgi:hypothetical protein